MRGPFCCNVRMKGLVGSIILSSRHYCETMKVLQGNQLSVIAM